MAFVNWACDGIKYLFVGCAFIWTFGMALLIGIGILGLILSALHVIR